MSYIDSSRIARRGFIARLSGAAVGFTTLVGSHLGAESLSGAESSTSPDGWIDRLTGMDRVVFHAHQKLLPALVGARNVLRNGLEAYGLPEAANSVAVATHGPAIAGLFRDEIWERYALGQRYKITDAGTGAPAAKNPFLSPQDGVPSDAVVPDLLNRGVVFVVCNVAVNNLARRVVQVGGDVDAVHQELVAGLVPGVLVVPDLFVAISHAQKKGVSYIFVD
jgi:intracellular sulfur oxidation DsrE/DsrF family protein